MRIVKLQAENVKKLKAVEITPDGAIVELAGANGSGKTSVLDAIWYALDGAEVIPDKVVRAGQDKAFVRLDLGELIVTRRFTAAGGTSLVVEQANGARFPSPQKILDGLVGALSFDPLAFTRLDAKQQLETLRKVVTLDVDLDQLDGVVRDLVTNRADHNRAIKQLEAQRAALVVPDDTPDDAIDLNAMIAELDAIGSENAQLERVRAQAAQDRARLDNDQRRAVKLREDAKGLALKIEYLQRQIAELEAQAVRLEDANIELAASIVTNVPDNRDTSELKQQITRAQQINRQVETKQARGRVDDSLAQLRTRVDELNVNIDRVTRERSEAVARATMPVAGLAFDESGVSFNGLPLENASSAEQLRVSVAIAMAANPKLRVLRVRDGSLLDQTSLKALAEAVAANDYQLWLERVEPGALSVVLEDGAIKSS